MHSYLFPAPSSIIIKTNETRRNQTVFGFGGTWSDSVVYNMLKLSDSARLNLLNSYYGPQGITLICITKNKGEMFVTVCVG